MENTETTKNQKSTKTAKSAKKKNPADSRKFQVKIHRFLCETKDHLPKKVTPIFKELNFSRLPL